MNNKLPSKPNTTNKYCRAHQYYQIWRWFQAKQQLQKNECVNSYLRQNDKINIPQAFSYDCWLDKNV